MEASVSKGETQLAPASGEAALGEILSQHYVLEYPYRRSLGPVLGRFFAALREGRILGVRTSAGRVLVPPAEYEPETGRGIDVTRDLVEVGTSGVVESWSWIAAPRPKHPLARPFAFALVKLDGADTALLHAVDAVDEGAMRTGMRVKARFADKASGTIRDLVCFEPTAEAATSMLASPIDAESIAPIANVKIPMRLDYDVIAGYAASRFLRSLADGKLIGQRCPRCSKVYMPPRGSCPTCGVPTDEEVPLPNTGTVTTFCIVNVPSESLPIPIPYAAASIRIDGADTSLFHLVRDIPVGEVRMGLRVKAVWKPREEWRPTLESIAHFSPTGEPDAPWDVVEGAL
jgi:uncharacterized OB-fold protein